MSRGRWSFGSGNYCPLTKYAHNDNWVCNHWAAVNRLSLLEPCCKGPLISGSSPGQHRSPWLAGGCNWRAPGEFLAGLPARRKWPSAPISSFQNAQMQPRGLNNHKPLHPLFVIVWAVPQHRPLFFLQAAPRAPKHHRPAGLVLPPGPVPPPAQLCRFPWYFSYLLSLSAPAPAPT